MAGNVPAQVLGWEDPGIKVRLIEPLDDLPIGTEISAVPAVARRGLSDVAMQQRRYGLRVGGVVVLLKASFADGSITWRAIDTIREKSDSLDVRIFRRIPVSVQPPKQGTALVDRATILLESSSVPFRNVSEKYGAIRLAAEEGCLFGNTGILIRGPDKKGDILHHLLPPDPERNAAIVMRRFFRQRLTKFLEHARASDGTWRAIPVVEMATDPLRASRMSAEDANFPSRLSDGTQGFKLCTAAIRYLDDDWVLSDATPLAIPPEVFGYDAPDEIFGLSADVA